MTHCEAKVLPIFNRMMIFGTTDFTYHGTRIRCGVSRECPVSRLPFTISATAALPPK